MPRLLEKVYVVLALLYFSGAFASRDIDVDPTAGDFALFALQCVIYAIAFSFMLLHRRVVEEVLRRGKWVLALSVLAAISTLWSGLPLFTLRRSIVMIATTLFGIYFGSVFPRRAQLNLLCCAFAAMALLSIGAAVAFPDYGIDHGLHEGDWCGIFPQKNFLGRLMVFGSAAFLLLPGERLKDTIVRAVGVITCLGLVKLSGSKTAFLMAILVVVLILFFKVLARKQKTFLVAGITVAALTLAFVWTNTDTILLWLSRDATLTGRIPLWIAAQEAISRQPFLGYGFGAFWQGYSGPSESIMAEVGWMAPHAHDGYLDLALDVGLVGLSIFVIGLLIRFRLAYRESDPRRRETLWPILYLTMILLYNIDESGLLRVNSIFCVLYASIFASGYIPHSFRLRGTRLQRIAARSGHVFINPQRKQIWNHPP